jgi:hypothetical protein
MPPLDAERLRTEVLNLTGLTVSSDVGDAGAVGLAYAHIGDLLDASGATLTNEAGPALMADRLQVDGDLLLRSFEATGSGDLRAVSLRGARIGGQLNAAGATMTNVTRPALYADRLQVDGRLYLRSFEATGSSGIGAVRLLGAHIGAHLEASDATMTNNIGPALAADRLHVDQSPFLRDGFKATGSGDLGALRLRNVRIGGQLEVAGASMTNVTGPALFADGIQVDGDPLLAQFEATGSGFGAVRLVSAHVGGRISVDAAAVSHPSTGRGKLALDGLVSAGLPKNPPADEWLDLLREQTSGYSPQPYQQLAAASQAAGHDVLTRKILMAQRSDQLALT